MTVAPKVARDITVDLLKGFGILTVVAGHCKFPLTLWINPYAFHMPLFFFIAGFFLKFNTNHYDFVRNKAYKLLFPFYKYCFAFAVITWLLHWTGIPFVKQFSFERTFSFENFFINPFLHCHHFQLICPLWFVTTLFLVMVLISFSRGLLELAIKTKKSSFISFVTFFILCGFLAAVTPLYKEVPYQALLGRTLICWAFCCMGYIAWKHRNLFFSKQYLILFTLLFLILCFWKKPGYVLVWSNFRNGTVQHLFPLVSLFGIYFAFSVVYLIKEINYSPLIRGLCWLGRKSFHIMALHLFGFLLLNIFCCYSDQYSLNQIKNVYFQFPIHKTYYFVFGLAFSVLCCLLYDKIQKRLFS